MELNELAQALAKRNAELEATKAKELSNTAQRLAELQQKEEARQRAVRDAQRAATAAAIRRRIEAQVAEEQLLRENVEKRVLEEQAYAAKQNALEHEGLTAKELEHSLIEQQHIEEEVRKSLANAKFSVRRTVGNEGEIILPHPLARFLQKSPE
jgi:hypothetical protein